MLEYGREQYENLLADKKQGLVEYIWKNKTPLQVKND